MSFPGGAGEFPGNPENVESGEAVTGITPVITVVGAVEPLIGEATIDATTPPTFAAYNKEGAEVVAETVASGFQAGQLPNPLVWANVSRIDAPPGFYAVRFRLRVSETSGINRDEEIVVPFVSPYFEVRRQVRQILSHKWSDTPDYVVDAVFQAQYALVAAQFPGDGASVPAAPEYSGLSAEDAPFVERAIALLTAASVYRSSPTRLPSGGLSKYGSGTDVVEFSRPATTPQKPPDEKWEEEAWAMLASVSWRAAALNPPPLLEAAGARDVANGSYSVWDDSLLRQRYGIETAGW